MAVVGGGGRQVANDVAGLWWELAIGGRVEITPQRGFNVSQFVALQTAKLNIKKRWRDFLLVNLLQTAGDGHGKSELVSGLHG